MNSKSAASPASAPNLVTTANHQQAGISSAPAHKEFRFSPSSTSFKADLQLLRSEALALARQAREGFSSSLAAAH